MLFGSLYMMTSLSASAADYGLPSKIQDGNILHCFNWPASEVKAALPQIAAAGFGAVQLSPLQRPDVKASGTSWHDLYRPYDLAFKSSGFCSEQDLRDLCATASGYGIKIVVDVVANHVDKTAGYHDTWWDSNNRVRWEGGISGGDYDNNRYKVTHGQLGDYGDVNSELSEVIARGKAYVQQLAGMGVKGIRWDAAKHIGLPSEGCNFWREVTSVSGVWHYGEILDSPVNNNPGLIKEYAQYMSVTDNNYSNYPARDNGGIATGYGGDWAVNYGLGGKVVYWGESHDTYSNDEWSQDRDQGTIDRAYACFATRSNAVALYFARPNTKGFHNIKTGKGSTAFTSKHIAAVNKLRNCAGSARDYYTHDNGKVSITREGIGACIVMKGSGNVSIANGGGYCPSGSYKDLVSGSTFNVTSSTISGNVGSSGIAVIIKDGVTLPDVNPGDDPVVGGGDMWVLGNLEGAAGWSKTPGTGVKMTASGTTYTAKNVKFVLSTGESKCFFNLTDYVGATWDDLNMSANRYGAAAEGTAVSVGSTVTVTKYANNVDASGCLSWSIAPGTYDIVFDASAMTLKVVNAGEAPDNPTIPDTPDTPDGPFVIYFDNSDNWASPAPYIWAWKANEDNLTGGTWPGVQMTRVSGDLYKWESTVAPYGIIFTNGSGEKAGGHTSEAGAGDILNPVSGTTYNSSNQIVPGSGYIDGIGIDDASMPVVYYNLQGIRVDNPSSGMYLRCQGRKVIKVML